ncbi:MAG: phage virion morphogenesis protein [Proteobacteria bacterium]|nr:MAG: phage virion morphogenesis protein [Pseudomonadota bacterium]
MTAALHITIDDAAVKGALTRLIAAGQSLHAPMDEIGASLLASTQQRFEEGKSPTGTPWKPSIRASRDGGVTLVDRGHLSDSMTHRASDTEVEVGTNVLYAAVHQFGATINAKTSKGLRFKIGDKFITKQSVTIPARPFLGISEDDAAEIQEILADHLREAVA